MNIENLLKELNIKYEERENKEEILQLCDEAFTHLSYVHEARKKDVHSYERLEFLGDSVLGQVVANYIFKKGPDIAPGEMTLLRSKVVNKDFLSMISKKLKFKDYIKTGKGESNSELSKSIYEDVFESFIGALYIGMGYDEAKRVIEEYICSKIDSIDLNNLKDYKTKLQEFLQAESGKSVEYIVTNSVREGERKEMLFEIEAVFEGNVYGKGKGKSKKEAEQKAAKEAFEKLTN